MIKKTRRTMACAGLAALFAIRAHADTLYGTILLRKPMVATLRLVGTLGERGDIELHSANGVQANGVIQFNGDAFQAAMFNVAPPGKVFSDGSTRRPFNVSGQVRAGVMAGTFSEEDEGTFIICRQDTYQRTPDACDGR